MSEHKDPERVAAGYKATIHNPNVSQDAKNHALKELHAMGRTSPSEGVHETHAGPGSSPRSASEQKRVRREVGDIAGAEGYHHKNEGNIVGGYKATLRNPHASKEAKKNAAEYLRSHGVDLEPYQDEIKNL